MPRLNYKQYRRVQKLVREHCVCQSMSVMHDGGQIAFAAVLSLYADLTLIDQVKITTYAVNIETAGEQKNAIRIISGKMC